MVLHYMIFSFIIFIFSVFYTVMHFEFINVLTEEPICYRLSDSKDPESEDVMWVKEKFIKNNEEVKNLNIISDYYIKDGHREYILLDKRVNNDYVHNKYEVKDKGCFMFNFIYNNKLFNNDLK